MVDNSKYSGYTNTDEVRETAGIKDDQDDWPNYSVNQIIKGVEQIINAEIGITANMASPPESIQLAAEFIASAVIKFQNRDPDDPWRDDLEVGIMFLTGYLKNPAAFASRFGYMTQSGYLTKPSNPDAETYLTTGDW